MSEIPMHPDECKHGNTHVEGTAELECPLCKCANLQSSLERYCMRSMRRIPAHGEEAMTRACKHENVSAWSWSSSSHPHWYAAYPSRRDDLLASAIVCNHCHAWLPLGPSDETDPRVAIEIDAARRAQEWADENYKPGADRFDWCPAFGASKDELCDVCHALYGAHCIATHDEHTDGDQ